MGLFGNIRAWRGQIPNALIGGRVDAHAGASAPGVFAVVKSVQRGYSVISLLHGTATFTIPNAVVPSKSVVLVEHSGDSVGYIRMTAIVTGSTTVTLTDVLEVSTTWRAEWQVVEFS